MDRREALKTTSFVIGMSLSASALPVLLHGCRSEAKRAEAALGRTFEPEYFDRDQIDLIAGLAETILPETDTPGAKTVGVHEFIDEEVKYMYSEDDQNIFVDGLREVQERAQATCGRKFQACSTEERVTLLSAMEQETSEETGRRFVQMLKEMTFRGYFTCEKIGKEVLRYDPIPGMYLGCVDIAAEDRMWTL
jgi:hypothetical protein